MKKNDPGIIRSVRGSVVDVFFPKHLPDIYSRLVTGKDSTTEIEVISHLSANLVRCVALTQTSGLVRGMTVRDTNAPFMVPVGNQLLGRMLNVFGDTIDGKPPIEGSEWRSIHQPPVPMSQQATKTEIFETGIKAIDVLAPLERGGRAGCSAARGSARPCLSPN
jgi:F-type H+/Na+-transporting ATPase subunit beta